MTVSKSTTIVGTFAWTLLAVVLILCLMSTVVGVTIILTLAFASYVLIYSLWQLVVTSLATAKKWLSTWRLSQSKRELMADVAQYLLRVLLLCLAVLILFTLVEYVEPSL